jgi:long-chain acyl-CoA synthetase
VSAATAVATDILHLGSDDIVLAGIPLLTVPGQTYCLNASMAVVAQLIVPAEADVDGLLHTIEQMKVTVLTTTPLMLPALVRGVRQIRPDLRTLRAILVAGGSTVPARVRAAVQSTLDCDLVECYGPPEFSSLACVTGLDGKHAEGSVGKCLESVQVAVEDADPRTGVGELLLRGDHTMLGYWKDRKATDRAVRDGWLRTGTGARVAPSGDVYLSEGGWMGRLTASEGQRPRLRNVWRARRRPRPVRGDDRRR